MPDETPTPVEQPLHLSLTLPSQAGNPFQPADAPESPLKLLPTSPSPAGDRWMNIFHGDETWQGRWPAENDALLSLVDDPGELKMASANALWIAEHLGESHDAVTRAYPMALGLTSLQLLGHMDGTDRDVHEAIGNDMLPRIDESQLQASLQHPLSGIEQPVHELVTLGNWVPELDEARAYSSYGGKVAHVSFAGKGGVAFVPSAAQSEQLGRDVYVPTSRQPVEPGGKGVGHTALNIVKSVAGGLSEGTLSMIEGAGFLADKTLEYLPGYRGSTADTWINATVEGFESQRRLMNEFYAVDPEFAESYVGKISSAVGSTVPQLVSFVVPPLAVAGIAGQSFLYAYEDARNTAARLGQPFDPNRAYAYAATMAVANTALTFLKFNVAVRPWLKPQAGPLTNTLFKLFKTSVAVGGMSAFQGGVNDFGAWAFDIEKRNPADLKRRWDDFVVGAGTGAVLGLGGLAVNRPTEKPPQSPSEKPAVTFDKSLGKQEVPRAPDAQAVDWSKFQRFENLFGSDEVGVPIQVYNFSQLNALTGKLNYVVKLDGTLRIGRRRRTEVGGGHIDLAGGAPVLAAGEILIIDGVIKWVNNQSGHYQPHGSSAREASIAAFSREGFDIVGKYQEYK